MLQNIFTMDFFLNGTTIIAAALLFMLMISVLARTGKTSPTSSRAVPIAVMVVLGLYLCFVLYTFLHFGAAL